MTRRRITVALSKPGATISGRFRGQPTAADVEALRVIGEAALAREAANDGEEARHGGDDPWSKYERAKAVLARTARSPTEYEQELKAIADMEGV